MGRRNTVPKSTLQVFQRLNSFESADSKKTLPCLGLNDYSPTGTGLFEKHNRINRVEECCIDRLSRHDLSGLERRLAAGFLRSTLASTVAAEADIPLSSGHL